MQMNLPVYQLSCPEGSLTMHRQPDVFRHYFEPEGAFVWNLRALIRFPVPISSFVFLPSPLAMSVSVVIFLLTDHSSENSQIFSLGRSWAFLCGSC